MLPPASTQSSVRCPLNEVFGSRGQVRLLRVLAAEASKALRPSEVGTRAGMTESGARRGLRRLARTGVVERVGDAKLVIIGEKIPYSRPWIINPGSIPHEDVPLFINACKAGLAPIFSGSGTRLKILEYLAAGLPVVATEKGAEGLDSNVQADIFIRNSAGEFTDQIANILEAGNDNELAARGRAAVRSKYAWRKIMDDFYEVVCSVSVGEESE